MPGKTCAANRSNVGGICDSFGNLSGTAYHVYPIFQCNEPVAFRRIPDSRVSLKHVHRYTIRLADRLVFKLKCVSNYILFKYVVIIWMFHPGDKGLVLKILARDCDPMCIQWLALPPLESKSFLYYTQLPLGIHSCLKW